MDMFTVAGVSTQNGITKVRFANDLVSRTKLLSKGGHSPLELIELPKAMTKADACQYLLDQGGVFEKYTDLITQTMGKKVALGTPAPKATKSTKAPSKTAQVVVAAAVKTASAKKATKVVKKQEEEVMAA